VVKLAVIETAKAKKKARSNLRVSQDDLRRYQEIYRAVEGVLDDHQVVAMGIEVYQAGFQGAQGQRRGGGAASKTLGVYGMLVGLGTSRRLFVSPGLPSDVKRRFVGKQSASKAEVVERMCSAVEGLREALEGFPKTKREHVADAAAHAVLVLDEMDEARIRMGLG
jgi:Holliday junction resolvasome RuvABC endonuclease subunit